MSQPWAAPAVRGQHHMFLHESFDYELNVKHTPSYLLRYRVYFESLNAAFPFLYPKEPFSYYHNLPALERVNCVKTIYQSFHKVDVKKGVLSPIDFDKSNKELLAAMGESSILTQHPLY